MRTKEDIIDEIKDKMLELEASQTLFTKNSLKVIENNGKELNWRMSESHGRKRKNKKRPI